MEKQWNVTLPSHAVFELRSIGARARAMRNETGRRHRLHAASARSAALLGVHVGVLSGALALARMSRSELHNSYDSTFHSPTTRRTSEKFQEHTFIGSLSAGEFPEPSQTRQVIAP